MTAPNPSARLTREQIERWEFEAQRAKTLLLNAPSKPDMHYLDTQEKIILLCRDALESLEKPSAEIAKARFEGIVTGLRTSEGFMYHDKAKQQAREHFEKWLPEEWALIKEWSWT